MKKAVCILEDKRRRYATRWEDGAYSIISFYLIMSVSTCFSFVGNLAHNATRLPLSNEPFLLIKSCVFLCSWCTFMQITYWAHLLYLQNHCTKNSLVFFLFSSQNNKHDPMFSQGFLGNQSFNTKTKIKLVFVLINKFWKFKWYPNTYKKPERQGWLLDKKKYLV